MNIGRIIEMLKLDKSLEVDVLVPLDSQTITSPEGITKEYPNFNRVRFLRQQLTDHAIKTRYDFRYNELEALLKNEKYTHVYINDPMLLRNYKSLFYKSFNYQPRFITHSHFIDNPEAPKVPKEVS